MVYLYSASSLSCSLINHCKGSMGGGGGGGIPVHRRHPRKIKAENGARGERGNHRRQQQQQHGEREMEREQRVVGVVTGPEAVIPMQPASHCCHHHQGIVQHCQSGWIRG